MRFQCGILTTMNFLSHLVNLILQVGSNDIFFHSLVLSNDIRENRFHVIVKAAILNDVGTRNVDELIFFVLILICCKDNANKCNESLLSNCRVQLIFCKDNKNTGNQGDSYDF